MANTNPVLPPELASILATLSQHNPRPTALARDTHQQVHDSSSLHQDRQQHQSVPQGRTPQPARPFIDPAAITEWSAGLRCVSKIAAQNDHFADSIRRLIGDQRKHEMQWYAGRQALKQEQARRGTGSTEIRSILKAVGGTAMDEDAQPQTADELQAEILAFDQKVYRAQISMNDSMTHELKALGVPFFGTQASLLKSEAAGDPEAKNGERPKWSPRITAQELSDLKTRMVRYLEDMYKD